MLTTILIGLLTAFLEWLFQKWLNKTFDPTPQALEEAKPKFLSSVKWRFWLGPDRMTKAEELYNKSVSRYKTSAQYVAKINRTPKQIAAYLTEDLD